MNKWRVVVWVAPFSSGEGHDVDQKKVGPSFQDLITDAGSFTEASKLAKVFLQGISQNPAVWSAEIISVSRYDTPPVDA